MKSLQTFKYAAIVLAAFLCTGLSAQFRTGGGYGELYDSETVVSLRDHVGYITAVEHEGRKAGSPGEAAVASYVYRQLKEYGVEMLCPEDGDKFGIASPAGDTLTSRNVYGFVQGYDKQYNGRYILIGARMDNLGVHRMKVDGQGVDQVYSGANGNASGLSMLLELGRMISTNSLLFRRSVILVGFGASSESFAGSWYFLNRAFSDVGRIDAMINLDMLGTGNKGFYAYTSSNTDMNGILAEVSNQLQPVYPQLRADEPYPSDHRTFYAKEIPSVYFTTGRYPEHNTPKDTDAILDYDGMELELEYLYNFTLHLANKEKTLSFRDLNVPQKGDSQEDVVPYYDCDQRPMFLNSTDPGQFLKKWVYAYLKYPPEAVEEGIQGTVHVSFIVDRAGKVQDVKVSRSVHPLLDEEAVKVVSASPKWRPGRVRGEKVRTSVTVPVEFRLKKKSERKKFGIKY